MGYKVDHDSQFWIPQSCVIKITFRVDLIATICKFIQPYLECTTWMRKNLTLIVVYVVLKISEKSRNMAPIAVFHAQERQ